MRFLARLVKRQAERLASVLNEANATASPVNPKPRPYRLYKKEQLPRPPVPSLDHTMIRLLEYAQTVADSTQQYDAFKQHVQHYSTSQTAQHVQQKLNALAETEDNWINEFWMNEMYLKTNRLALPLNSSPAYVFPKRTFVDIEDQIRFMASFIRSLYAFKDRVNSRSLPQDMSTGREKVPLCMDQYWRLFSTYREPCLPSDVQHTRTQQGNAGNEHIIVMRRNQCFVVRTVVAGQQLTRDELVHQLTDAYQKADARPTHSIIPVAAITSAHRDTAAAAYQKLKQLHPENAKSLAWLQSCALVICFDEPTDEFEAELFAQGDMNELERSLSLQAHKILHGCGVNALNRWYNKNQNIMFSLDGCNGLLLEHSCAEGPAFTGMVEAALADVQLIYDRVPVPGAARRLYEAKPLTWHIDSQLRQMIEQAASNMHTVARDLEMNVFIYEGFGREFIKSVKCSPDAFMQIMLQLAYYKCHGRLCSTYESAGMRRFRLGRVDNIRANHPPAQAFAQTMTDPDATDQAKKDAFRAAIEKQTQIMIENITGHGIDNHLVALRDLTLETEDTEAAKLFDHPLFGELMRFPLSTSQVTTGVPGTFLCYGPVTEDGLGCAYNMQPDKLIFAISAFHKCAGVSARDYRTHLSIALDHTKALFS